MWQDSQIFNCRNMIDISVWGNKLEIYKSLGHKMGYKSSGR